jgi:hypothetical protein
VGGLAMPRKKIPPITPVMLTSMKIKSSSFIVCSACLLIVGDVGFLGCYPMGVVLKFYICSCLINCGVCFGS